MHCRGKQVLNHPLKVETTLEIASYPWTHHASSSEKWLPTGALVLHAKQIIREDIRVAQIGHFSPGVPFPLQPSIAHSALISPFGRMVTVVISPQSGHFPGRPG